MNRKMKMISMMGLMICLEACAFPRFNDEKPVERCGMFIVKVSESLYEGKCRCHDYVVRKGFIGRVSDSRDEPLDYCHKFIGYSPNDWGEFRNWFDDIYVWLERQRKKFNRASSK